MLCSKRKGHSRGRQGREGELREQCMQNERSYDIPQNCKMCSVAGAKASMEER